ncbi:MAG: AAA family ATPase [Gammaproteobacteria bacterium]|nr:AAA family ATPase [Gammaproteobacteria bacterium]MCY4255830.1 AAA family ATPase [Gammaproteobacteria bacterium]
MKLKSATVIEFKRFKDLKILGLPVGTKLIVLLGPNGCGKSSLFDAFQRNLKVDQFYGMSEELRTYYQRMMPDAPAESETITLEFHGNHPTTSDELKKSLYVRSAYRHDPYFRGTTIEQPGNVLDRHAVRRLIDSDQTVRNNYQRIIWQLLRQVTIPGLTTDSIMEGTIGDIQKSMRRVFGDISVDALVSNEEIGTFTFSKGISKRFPYENLSAGEKAAFDLLLDIVVNKVAFNDSLYCIDEPEAHLNTKVQRMLLEELYRLIPDNSQLWLATHSIGMVRAAQNLRGEEEDGVVFLDMGFDACGEERNYDQPQVLEPSCPDYQFWKRHYIVALDDLAELLAPEFIVLCEGSSKEELTPLDEACYNRIFAREFPRTRFVSVGAASAVEKRMKDLVPLLDQIIERTQVILFRDRDSSTPTEIEEKRTQGVPVRTMSKFRNVESMLLSDGVLKRLCESVGRSESFNAIKEVRDITMRDIESEYAIDDFKPSVQAVHHAARKELRLPQAGETKEAFMRDVLAPLVTEDTAEYQALKDDIFGGLGLEPSCAGPRDS